MSEPPVVYDDADELFRTAELVLESISTTFQEYEHPLPGRQYVTTGGTGDTVHDCEQVTISVDQIYSGTPGSQVNDPQKCDSPSTAVFIVEIVRCIPGSTKNGKPPTADTISQMARIQTRDMMLMKLAGLRAAEAQHFTGGIVDVMAGRPSGVYQAMVMNLIIPIYAGPQ